MAEEQQADRTEQASPRRLQQSYEKGELGIGRDLASAAVIGAGVGALLMTGPELRDGLVRLVWLSGERLATPNARELIPLLLRPVSITLTICAATALAAAMAVGIQTKMGMWPQLALPDFKRVFSGGKLSRLFKKEVLVDLALTFVKVVTVGTALWGIGRDEFVTLPRMLTMESELQLAAVFGPLANGLAKILTAFLVVAGVDFAITRFRFRERMKMTKEEAKREHREDEGDPLFRSRRKRQHRELVKGRVAVEVPRADALIVNPTHIAVAIRYRPGEDKAPRVTAKGKGQLAEMMRDLARQHGIPIVENIPLARLLYRRVKVGRTVPAETYRAVAAVLAFVYRVLRRSSTPSAGAVQ